MRHTRIKICGICRPEDASFAAECGVDAIGMVFHAPSPRSISIEQARAILRIVPPFVTPVALFVDATADQILDTTRSVGVRTVQLHGHETPELIAALKPLTVLKAVKVERVTFATVLADWKREIDAWRLDNLAGVLLETANTPQPGGTGVPNDWEAVRESAVSASPRWSAANDCRRRVDAPKRRSNHPRRASLRGGCQQRSRGSSPAKIERENQVIRRGGKGCW